MLTYSILKITNLLENKHQNIDILMFAQVLALKNGQKRPTDIKLLPF